MNTLIKSIKNTNECVWYCLLILKGVCKIQVLIQADPYCRVPQNWLIISLLKQSVLWKSMVSGRWWQSFTVSTKYIKYLPVFYWGFVSLFFSRQTKTPQSHRERQQSHYICVVVRCSFSSTSRVSLHFVDTDTNNNCSIKIIHYLEIAMGKPLSGSQCINNNVASKQHKLANMRGDQHYVISSHFSSTISAYFVKKGG